jgi:hypothetical protein
MYLTTVLLLMGVLPIVSMGADHFYFHRSAPLILLVGKWFVFWSAGVRLLLAGLRQFFQPSFTAREIFGITSDEVLPLVRELGVANFAVGVAGMIALACPGFVLPVAVITGIFYGVAGVRHIVARHRMRNEAIAMVSDLFVGLIMAAYVGSTAIG